VEAYSTPDDEKNLTEREIREWMCEVGRRLWVNQMVEANGGNLSYRLDENLVLASPTYISKGFLRPDDLVLLDLDGNQLSGRRKKTSEIKLHLTIFKERPDVKACVHAHPRHATAFAVAKTSVPKCVLPEIEVWVGEIPIAPYETPGTQEFADGLIPYLKDFSLILLGNHGAIAMGKGIMDAYWKLEIVEASCHTMMIAQQLGAVEPVQQSKMADIFKIKESLGIPDRRIKSAQAARCDIPAPTPDQGPYKPVGAILPAGCATSAPPQQDMSALVDQITKAVLARLK
jgi:L-fuculose-phosphate aldolase